MFVAVLMLAASGLFAQQAGSGPEEETVSVKVLDPRTAPRPGSAFSLFLEVTVKPGFHMNSDDPGDEYLFPAKVELTPMDGLELAKAVFPKGRRTQFAFSEGPVSVLEGVFKVELKLKLAAQPAGPEVRIKGKFRFQACNDDACLQPKAVPFEKTLRVGPGS